MAAKKWIIILIFGFLLPSFGQIPVWQGFDATWTYNHRLNRLGSFIYQDSVCNAAATGLGKDSGHFNTRYLLIDDDDIKFTELHFYKRIEAKEGELIHINIDTLIPISYHLSIFYLNGFDIIANNDADKIQMIDMGVKMIKGNNDSTYLKFQASFIFNCQSIECDWMNNDVDYDLHFYVGGITFLNTAYISYIKAEPIDQHISWDRKKGAPDYVNPINAGNINFITGFKFSLNKAHWYSGMACCIKPEAEFMRFEQYKIKMKKNAWYKPHANFSKKSKGSGHYWMQVITLSRPGNLIPVYQEYKSSVIWKGNNKSAFLPDAKHVSPIPKKNR